MRRPGIRSLAGGAAGIVAGVIGGIAQTSTSTASGPALAVPGLDAVHVPPVLTTADEAVTLRYAIVCPPRADREPCDGSGSVYVRSGQGGSFHRLPLSRSEVSGEGRYFVELPGEIASSRQGFSYYAVLRDDASGATVTVPAGGEMAPQRSFPLADATEVVIGPHMFGRGRAPDERVVTAPWGSDVGEVGLAGSRALGISGPSSFDVAADGTVAVLDQVNARVERWSRARIEATNLQVSGGLADFALEPDGTMDVLEPPNRTTPAPVLRSFRADGSSRWAQRLSDRTWAKLAAGPLGPTVQQQPSEQWLPVAEHGAALDRPAQAARGRPGRSFANGREVVVERVGAGELRLAELVGNVVVRSWRITSATPLGEVQLAEPHGNRLVVVTKTYTDDRSEYVVLVLDRSGVVNSFGVESLEWAESAPLARFRLAGSSSLYRLGSTRVGLFVDRFDVEVSR
ncbi:MAG: hypothetical protein M3O92_03765 [Actinomycetota bacterium]|nr:hypothetical protein [Actinomycetota bacterium]